MGILLNNQQYVLIRVLGQCTTEKQTLKFSLNLSRLSGYNTYMIHLKEVFLFICRRESISRQSGTFVKLYHERL